MQWVAPPNWPQPPSGWSPYPGWAPNPSWGPPPDDWQWWQSPEAAGAVRREYSAKQALYWVALLFFLPIYFIVHSLIDVEGAPWGLIAFGAGVCWLLFVGCVFKKRGHSDVVLADEDDYPVLRPFVANAFPRASAMGSRVSGSALAGLVLCLGSVGIAYWTLTTVPDGSVAGFASPGADCQEPAWRGALYGDPNAGDPSRCAESATDNALVGAIFLFGGAAVLLVGVKGFGETISTCQRT